MSQSPTHSVVLRLDPSAMENPDIDIRWEIEEYLHAAHPGVEFHDDGYGFASNSDAMMLSYATSDPDGLVAALVAMVTKGTVMGNSLAAAAMIAVALRDIPVNAGEEFKEHRVVYTPQAAGKPMPD